MGVKVLPKKLLRRKAKQRLRFQFFLKIFFVHAQVSLFSNDLSKKGWLPVRLLKNSKSVQRSASSYGFKKCAHDVSFKIVLGLGRALVSRSDCR